MLVTIFPTPKKDCICFNKCKSLPCNFIEKIGVSLHPIALSSLLIIEITKVPSASVKPVVQLGSNGTFIKVVKGFFKKQRGEPNNEPIITEITS